MRNQKFIKTRNNEEHITYHRSSRLGKTPFDILYEDMVDGWEDRAKRLQMRRWHRIKHQAV